MEISLHERELAYGNAHVRVVCRVLYRGAFITKNGYIVEFTEIESPPNSHRKSTNPCSVEPDRQRSRWARRSLTIIANWLVRFELQESEGPIEGDGEKRLAYYNRVPLAWQGSDQHSGKNVLEICAPTKI